MMSTFDEIMRELDRAMETNGPQPDEFTVRDRREWLAAHGHTVTHETVRKHLEALVAAGMLSKRRNVYGGHLIVLYRPTRSQSETGPEQTTANDCDTS